MYNKSNVHFGHDKIKLNRFGTKGKIRSLRNNNDIKQFAKLSFLGHPLYEMSIETVQSLQTAHEAKFRLKLSIRERKMNFCQRISEDP